MSLANFLEQKLQEAFKPTHIQVINDSHRHNVPAGSESHFTLVVVSDVFEGLPTIKRHRQINGLLADELKHKIHALSLKLFTPQEFAKLNQVETTPPPCLGGEKPL